MKAKEALKLSIESCSDEIKNIEELILAECQKGNTKLHINAISDASIEYFKQNGYEIVQISRELYGGREVIESLTIKWS